MHDWLTKYFTVEQVVIAELVLLLTASILFAFIFFQIINFDLPNQHTFSLFFCFCCCSNFVSN